MSSGGRSSSLGSSSLGSWLLAVLVMLVALPLPLADDSAVSTDVYQISVLLAALYRQVLHDWILLMIGCCS